jgi:lipopolysaccharide export system protein LptA
MFRYVLHSRPRTLAAIAALLITTRFAQADVAPAAGTFNYVADKISLTNNGVRLDGNAQITSPQLEVRAAAIAFDFKNQQITQVRALNRVNIKVNLVPKGGSETTHVEATCNAATLNPTTRELILKGDVDGFYQVGKNPRTTLAGTQATMTYVEGQPHVNIVGPVRVLVPAEATGAGAIGTVTVTSQNAMFDQKSGEVRFVGQARAVSADGPNKFDVSAPEMVITRGDGNTIDTLKTKGRTLLKIDLPPDPVKAEGAAGKIGKPTHVEVTSDQATVNRTNNTMVFSGNVTGFYQLAPVGSEPQRYDFSGTQATLRYVPDAEATADKPAGLKADIIGAPNKQVEVSTPAFNLNMGG